MLLGLRLGQGRDSNISQLVESQSSGHGLVPKNVNFITQESFFFKVGSPDPWLPSKGVFFFFLI